jgi:hypothetical protein
MRNSRKALAALCCGAALALLLILFWGYPASGLASMLFRELEPNPVEAAHPTTLLETWDVVQDYIRNHSPAASIAELVSVDHPGDSALRDAPGVDGRRRAWAVMLVTESTLSRLTVWDGEVVDHIDQPPEPFLRPVDKPLVDSPQAYRVALESYPWLAPNSNHGVGFHFSLGVGDPDRPALAVIAGKPGETLLNEALVLLDPSSGAVVGARARSFAQAGGILFSEDGGVSWQASNLTGKMTNAAARDPRHPGWGYAVTTDETQITLHQSMDGGKTWSELSRLPLEAGGWPTSIAVIPNSPKPEEATGATLIVTSRAGAWISADNQNWARVAGLSRAPIQWTAVMRTSKGYQVFASLIDASEKENGLYTSLELVDWQKIQSGGYYRLSESYDQSQVIAVEQNTGQAWRFTGDGSAPIELPLETMNVAGDFQSPERMVIRTGSSVRSLSATNPKESPIQVGVIAAAPDLPDSGILIAGGFRTGVFRSADFGRTWQITLADPSSIVAGNNEIGAAIFLSEKAVIVRNGGLLSWEALP